VKTRTKEKKPMALDTKIGNEYNSSALEEQQAFRMVQNIELSPSVTSPQAPTSEGPPFSSNNRHRKISLFKYNKRASLLTISVIVVLLLIAIPGFILTSSNNNKSSNTNSEKVSYQLTKPNLKAQATSPVSQLAEASQLSINGQLEVNNSIVLTPTSTPVSPVTGQVYYDQTTNQPYYYNGKQFISLTPSSVQGVTALGTSSGIISLGNGLQISSNQLSLTSAITQSLSGQKVTSLQGQTGNVSLVSGVGISINGLDISNSGVTSLSGTTNQIAISSSTGDITLSLPQSIDTSSVPTFAGINLTSPLGVESGGTGVSTLASGTVLLGNGTGPIAGLSASTADQCLLSTGATTAPVFGACSAGGGITGTGTDGTLAVFSGNDAVEDSIISELGTNVSVSGSLSVTGEYDVNGTQIASADLSDSSNLAYLNGDQKFSGSNTFEDDTNSTADFQVQDSSANDVLSIDTVNDRVGIDGISPQYALDVNGQINSNTAVSVGGIDVCTISDCVPAAGSNNYIQNGTTTQDATNFSIRSAANNAVTGILQGAIGQTSDILDLQGWDGTSTTALDSFASDGSLTIAGGETLDTLGTSGTSLLCENVSDQISTCNANAGSSSYILNQSGTAQAANFDIQAATSGTVAATISANSLGTSDILDIDNGSGTEVASVGDTGNTLLEASINSTSALQVQNASGQDLLQVDTANNNIVLGGNEAGQLQAWQTSSSTLPNSIFGADSVTANGYVYEIGGTNGSVALNSVYYAQLNANGSIGAWQTSVNALPTNTVHAASVFANGYIYEIGGGTSTYFAQVNASNGSVGAWQSTNSLPSTSNKISALVVNGYVYVFGGGASNDSVYYAQLNANGTVGTWQSSSNIPPVIANMPSFAANGYVYVASASGFYYATVNPNTGAIGTWQAPTTTFPTTISAPTAVVADGYVYVMGGQNVSSYSSVVYYAQINANGSIGAWQTNNYSLPGTDTEQSTSVVVNGYIYFIAGGNSGVGSNNTYYASTQRVELGGSLDLVGLAGSNLSSNGSGSEGEGSESGSLTAGDGDFVGNLQVAGQANFSQGVNVNNTLNVGGSEAIQTLTNTTSAFTIQNSSGSTLLDADTTTSRLSVDATNTPMSAPSTVSAVASGSTGTLAAGTYYYSITAVDSLGGETTATEYAQVTVAANNVVVLTWTPVNGAVGYHIYRTATNGASGSETGYYITSGTYSSGNLTFTDSGSAQNITTATPPLIDTASVANNTGNNAGQLSVGGNGTASGQLYVSGTIPTAPVSTINTGTSPQDIAIVGHYAYVVTQTSDTLQVFDVSDPTTPVLISTTSTGTSSPTKLAAVGHYVYIINAGSPYSLQIYNVSNPSAPTLMSNTTTGNQPQGITLQGHYAYVVNNSSSSLQIFDVTNPSSPSLAGSVTTSAQPQTVVVQGRYAYVGASVGAKLQIFDVSNPASISSVSSTTTTSGTGIFAVQDRIAYVGTNSGLTEYDVSNPVSPVELSAISTGFGFSYAMVQGQYLYATSPASGTTGFQIFDVANPAQIFRAGTVTSPSSSQPRWIAISGRYAYVLDSGLNTLRVYDLGGSYIQQLQAGGLEVTTAHVDNDLIVDGAATLNNGLALNGGLQENGSVGIDGSLIISPSSLSTPASVATATATAASSTVQVTGAIGGSTSIATTGTGGGGSALNLVTGAGGSAASALTASTGGAGGLFTLNGGTGGAAAVAGTGNNTGGGGGAFSFVAGTGGSASGVTSGTDTGGAGGSITLQSGTGGAASSGSGALAGGAGGTLILQAGTGGSGTTTGGGGGAATLQAGSAAGLNAAGGTLTISGGIGTGTGNGGTITFKIATPSGTSGSTSNTLATVASLSGVNGAAIFSNSANSTTAFQIQSTTDSSFFVADTTNYIITISGTASQFATLALTNSHFESTQTTAPSIATPTACGTSPTASVTVGSTDSAGSFTLTSGSTTTTATCQVVITFNKAYSSAPKSIIITGASANASKMTPAVSAIGTTTFTVLLPQTDTLSTAYQFYYWIVE
jgi:hypothetical protein